MLNQIVMREAKRLPDKDVLPMMCFPGRTSRNVALLLIFVTLGPSPASANPATPGSRLTSPTLDAFNRYVHLVEARSDAELGRGADLLWVDRLPKPERERAYQEL